MNISEDKKGWLSEYSEMHSLSESNIIGDIPPNTGDEHSLADSDFPSLLPLAMKVSAQTIGQNLVSVQPMNSMPNDELERIITRIKQENRQAKIDSIVEEREFIEKQLEQDEEYQELCTKYEGPKATLMYLDFKYGTNENDSDEE